MAITGLVLFAYRFSMVSDEGGEYQRGVEEEAEENRAHPDSPALLRLFPRPANSGMKAFSVIIGLVYLVYTLIELGGVFAGFKVRLPPSSLLRARLRANLTRRFASITPRYRCRIRPGSSEFTPWPL